MISRGGLRRRHHWLRREIEWYSEHVRVFSAEQALVRAVFVQIVGLSPQRTAHDLLTEQLCAEGADAQNVGDRIRVPTLGQHGNRHDATDGIAQLAWFADGVHDLP